MCCGLIWGTVLILFGASVLVSVLLGINIPLFRICLGLALLYLGVQLITCNKSRVWYCGNFCHQSAKVCKTCFGNCNIHVDDRMMSQDSMSLEYATVFGNSVIDLSDLTLEAMQRRADVLLVSINTVFGKTDLKLNKDIPVRIVGKSAFAKTSFPDGNMVTFGTHSYTSHAAAQMPLIVIQSNTVFGNLEIEAK